MLRGQSCQQFTGNCLSVFFSALDELSQYAFSPICAWQHAQARVRRLITMVPNGGNTRAATAVSACRQDVSVHALCTNTNISAARGRDGCDESRGNWC
jgi:hypothetical protein